MASNAAIVAQAATSAQTFNLMALPSEIRLIIYDAYLDVFNQSQIKYDEQGQYVGTRPCMWTIPEVLGRVILHNPLHRPIPKELLWTNGEMRYHAQKAGMFVICKSSRPSTGTVIRTSRAWFNSHLDCVLYDLRDAVHLVNLDIIPPTAVDVLGIVRHMFITDRDIDFPECFQHRASGPFAPPCRALRRVPSQQQAGQPTARRAEADHRHFINVAGHNVVMTAVAFVLGNLMTRLHRLTVVDPESMAVARHNCNGDGVVTKRSAFRPASPFPWSDWLAVRLSYHPGLWLDVVRHVLHSGKGMGKARVVLDFGHIEVDRSMADTPVFSEVFGRTFITYRRV